ncbi:MAG: YggS family pyridoxal phosphate-dependent enzyme [Candidatus Dormibacteria bacterium]
MEVEAGAGPVSERVAMVRDRIAAACARCDRDPAQVTLIAVTKGHPAAAVRAVVAAGLHDIGESRVQETRAKRAVLGAGLPAGVRWHLVGQLQTNKARAAASLFDVVHSLDSERLAAALGRGRSPAPAPLRVLIEVELTGLAGRGGVTPEHLDALFGAARAHPQLRVAGLMSVAAPGSAESARASFARLRGLRDQLEQRHQVALPHLSMGMSDDFEVGVEEGATMVRVGRALFDPRSPIS